MLAVPASAQEAAPPPEPPPEPQHFLSFTLSPLHLIFPIAELTIEVKAADLVGIALVGGVGTVSAVTFSDQDLTFMAYEFGVQGVVYPIEPFESLQLGAELLYLQVSVEDEIGNQQVEGLGAGLAVGPLVGYKLLTSIGFTFFVQGGVSFVAIRAEAENDLGESATEDESRVLPLLNLNVGWSI